MPLSIRLHGHALKEVTIAKGLDTGMDGVQFAYLAMTNMLFESIDSFMQAYSPHAEQLQGDMINYTNIQPVIQFSEVIINKK
jgi:uncharacterized protein (TIGR02118 family)